VFLIVAPLSVLYNWKDELDTWGHFQCVVVHGLRKEEELARIKKGRIEIALTTYETLRLCLDQFNNIDWSAVVVDEAHKIKNPSSQITQAMKELKCKIRIGLTGTILQNNLEELWCVMDWAIPGCLGNLGHFKNKFSDPIEQGQRHSATKRALATGRKTVRALVRKISHWFLRRTKALIREQLPKKNDRVVYCSLTDFQQTVYQTVLDTEDVTLLLRSSEKCGCQSGRTRRSCCYKANSEGVQIKELYFSYLAILRKVANHVALLQSTAGTSKKQEKYVSAVCQKVFQKFPDFVQRCKDEAFEALSDPMYSGKMKVLQKLLKYYLRKRDKVLLFSLSTKLLDVLESYCMAEGLDYKRLDGATKSKERVQIVKDFNSSSHINLCLVSTMAGGLGLNFVGANVVVLFDPTWNPANDLQAIDRAYRIGQCRDVTVLRLISLGTVEEVIYLRQVYKQQLQCSVIGKESSRRYFEAVQGHGVHKGELYGIKNLFRLQTQGTCLTRKILELFVSTVLFKEPGQSPSTECVAQNDEPAKENKDSSKVPKGVLDFSSGSEEDEDEQRFKRKASNPSAVDGNRGGSAATGPGRMSLLQHGFSRFLERVKSRPESGKGDGSSLEESPSDTDTEDLGKFGKNECTSSGINKRSNTGNDAVCVPKLRTKTWDISSGLDREDRRNGGSGRQERVSLLKESDDAVRKRQSLKGWTNKDITVEGESDENFSPDKKPNKLKTTVPTAHCFEGYSDESEDFDLEPSTLPKKGALNSHCRGQDSGRGSHDSNRKRQSTSVRNKARSKHTEAIETYTSSEDERTPVKKGRSTGCHFTERTERHTVSFTTLKSQTSPASKGKAGTIDSVLGDVQEVVYTHSNQRVVGGSKAEEMISRAAVRHVFERKMYSQLPANHFLGTLEVLTASQKIFLSSLSNTFFGRGLFFILIFVFVSFSVLVCRQHLEEMAEKFKCPSVHQFAVEILSRNSSQRLAWLRQYYTSLNYPDLANTVTKHFPHSDSAQTSSTSAASSSTSTKTAATKSHTETRTPQKDVAKATRKPKYTQKNLGPKPQPEILQNHVPQTNPKNPQNDVLEPQKKQKISQKNALEPPSNVSSPESEGIKETFQGITLSTDSGLLDSLSSPSSHTSTTHQVSTPVQASKGGRKDFWDILNEGNEESINRLTDPAEVQRVCVNTNFLARSRSEEEESKSLWKTNEKFLWKK
uniref:Excision repair cross-complementation group 6-like 2 n=1 Tax=Lates calcarifer TaxID=8187 RepID=A0A4W6CKF7_LATCA